MWLFSLTSFSHFITVDNTRGYSCDTLAMAIEKKSQQKYSKKKDSSIIPEKQRKRAQKEEKKWIAKQAI